jgi:hypothetical protein
VNFPSDGFNPRLTAEWVEPNKAPICKFLCLPFCLNKFCDEYLPKCAGVNLITAELFLGTVAAYFLHEFENGQKDTLLVISSGKK